MIKMERFEEQNIEYCLIPDIKKDKFVEFLSELVYCMSFFGKKVGVNIFSVMGGFMASVCTKKHGYCSFIVNVDDECSVEFIVLYRQLKRLLKNKILLNDDMMTATARSFLKGKSFKKNDTDILVVDRVSGKLIVAKAIEIVEMDIYDKDIRPEVLSISLDNIDADFEERRKELIKKEIYKQWN